MTTGDVAPLAAAGAPCRIGARHAFIHERLLVEIARATAGGGALTLSKRDLGRLLGCSQRMVDNGVSRLRAAGEIESHTRFDESGGQLASEYRATEAGLVHAFRLIAKADSHDFMPPESAMNA